MLGGGLGLWEVEGFVNLEFLDQELGGFMGVGFGCWLYTRVLLYYGWLSGV